MFYGDVATGTDFALLCTASGILQMLNVASALAKSNGHAYYSFTRMRIDVQLPQLTPILWCKMRVKMLCMDISGLAFFRNFRTIPMTPCQHQAERCFDAGYFKARRHRRCPRQNVGEINGRSSFLFSKYTDLGKAYCWILPVVIESNSVVGGVHRGP